VITYNAASDKVRSLAEKALNSIEITTMSDAEAAVLRILNAGWQERYIGETGITALAPEKMEKKEVQMDASAAEGLERYDLYVFPERNFLYTVQAFISKDNEFNAKNYAEEIASRINHLPDVASYNYEITDIEIAGMKGIKMVGKAEKEDMIKQMDSITLADGKKLYHIAISYDSEEERLSALAEKLFSSINIK